MGGELPLLPFGNPIGFVPASKGGVNIESERRKEQCFDRKRIKKSSVGFV